MAMYEDKGYCPNNSFLHCAMEFGDNIPKLWNRTRELLGDRTAYMVYTPNGVSYYGWPYVCDALIGATSTMGIEIACQLQNMIPECTYAETGRMILVTDVLNPFAIPHIGRGYDSNGHEILVSIDPSMHLFQDDRYICGIIDEGTAVHMYFFKLSQGFKMVVVDDPNQVPEVCYKDDAYIVGVKKEYPDFTVYVCRMEHKEE